jgi:hypothetical protein
MARPYTAVDIAPADVVDCHAKPVLALLWRLVLCFQVHERPDPQAAAAASLTASSTATNASSPPTSSLSAIALGHSSVSALTSSASAPSSSSSSISSSSTPTSAVERQRLATQKLLLWLKKTLSGVVSASEELSLTESFRDGYLLLALIHAYDGKLVDMKSVTRGKRGTRERRRGREERPLGSRGRWLKRKREREREGGK